MTAKEINQEQIASDVVPVAGGPPSRHDQTAEQASQCQQVDQTRETRAQALSEQILLAVRELHALRKAICVEPPPVNLRALVAAFDEVGARIDTLQTQFIDLAPSDALKQDLLRRVSEVSRY